mgnify:CR=1 FL=1
MEPIQLLGDGEEFHHFMDFLEGKLSESSFSGVPPSEESFGLQVKSRTKYGAEHDTVIWTGLVKLPELEERLRTLEADYGVPVDSTVAYLYLTPRCERRSAEKVVASYLRKINEEVNGGPKHHYRLDKEFVVQAMNTPDPKRKKWIEIDVDYPDIEESLIAGITERGGTVDFKVRTRGGIHLVIDRKELENGELSKWLYTEVATWQFDAVDRNGNPLRKKMADVRSDPCIPIPGTLQGGKLVKFF